MTFLELHAHTRRPRGEAVEAARDALMGAGAWVTDYREFSNKAVCLMFETDDAQSLGSLAVAGLTAASLVQLTALTGAARGTLALTLIHDEPDEKQFIPAVPG